MRWNDSVWDCPDDEPVHRVVHDDDDDDDEL